MCRDRDREADYVVWPPVEYSPLAPVTLPFGPRSEAQIRDIQNKVVAAAASAAAVLSLVLSNCAVIY